jgi:CDP-glycerol glycerophosphotransferase (TagB/SpsB family)
MSYLKKIKKRYKYNGFINGTKYYFFCLVGSIHIIFSGFLDIISNAVFFVEKHLPIKENIVFECESDFADNPRVFYEYIKNKTDFLNKHKAIWLVNKVDYCNEHFGTKNVLFFNRNNSKLVNRIKLNYFLGTSKWFIFSHPYWFTNWREKQIVINVSHGISQMKGISVTSIKAFDYAICTCSYTAPFIAMSFNCDPRIIIGLGVPRIDDLFCKDIVVDRLIPNYIDQKIILSMETFKQAKNFKDSESLDAFSINVIHRIDELLDLDHFLQRENCFLIVKIHPLQDVSLLKQMNLTNIFYFTNDDLLYADIRINQLLTNADILLTDYSSVFYDYLFVNRPIGFMVSDIEKYSRGFVYDNPLDEMPGEKIHQLDELKCFITESLKGKDSFIDERKRILEKVIHYKDENNCERLYNWINSLD